MQLDTARLLISSGVIRGAYATPFMGKWALFFTAGPNCPESVPLALEGARGSLRVWADLDRLVSTVVDLGLSEVTVKPH